MEFTCMPILHFVLDKGFATHCMFTFLLIITATVEVSVYNEGSFIRCDQILPIVMFHFVQFNFTCLKNSPALLPDTDSWPFSYVIVILSTCQQL